ncbi:patatin-like phospholipase family protein [Oceanirhabdus sp. W0125-5]|uniref:patatin-like phospholipase family protein n=1 Tax=Oceanirhabdus sp. W0125-5 TaxID=2999116 RepID=UPI0022F2E8DE|nr:patatin-like phospholipase family protein [Oceanirhabdus sp. W0125-5]WBW98535.1 patatin-like phospholipase family protein [Oceanirhabdus sp. W0125-5]
MKANLVCAGGGLRGVGIVGALCALEREGISWEKAAGVSSGAIIASLIAVGYTAHEIKKMMIDFNFLKFKDKGVLGKIPFVGNAIGLVKDKGIYSGKKLEKWMEKLLEEKGVRTFQDLNGDNGMRLKVIASDITSKKEMIMPDCFEEYGIDINKFTVAKAIRMSVSIPLFFKPVKIKVDGVLHYIVDGGVSTNFPIEIFDRENNSIETIGIDYKYTENYGIKQDNAISYVLDIADTLTADRVRPALTEKNIKRTILIPCNDLPITEFKLSREAIIKLFKDGYKSARVFVQKRGVKT